MVTMTMYARRLLYTLEILCAPVGENCHPPMYMLS